MDEPGAEEPRTLAGRYRLIEPIGRGGMGRVWRAVDTLLDREAAVKEVHVPSVLPETERGEMYQRTLREARTAARLRHPNVVTLFDVVEEDDRPWIVMELVHARSLDRVVADEGPMRPDRAAHVGRQVLSALTAAHARGVLHRDVKPANVLVGEGDRVTLTDFGIATIEGDASITQSGQLVGSPAYLGPERAAGEVATAASDLWALGATLFMAVEGHGPYDRDGGPIAALGAVLTQDQPPAPHAGPLAPVIDGLLARDPAQRMGPEQAAELLDGVASGRSPADDQSTAVTPAALPGPPAPLPEGWGSATPPGSLPAPTRTDTPVPYGAPAGPTGPYGPTGPHGPYGSPAAYAPPGEPPVPARRSRTPLVLGGVAVIAVLAMLAVGLWLLHLRSAARLDAPNASGPSKPAGHPRASTRWTPAKSAKPSGGPALPVGFARRKDPDGFSVAMPRAWGDRMARGNSVTYFNPGHTAYLLVDRTVQPTGNPMANMRRFIKDARRDGKYKNARTLSLHRMRYLGRPAAVWDFTWTMDNGTPVHAEDRQVVLPNGEFIAVYWQSLDRMWAGTRLARSTAFATLRLN